MDRERFPEAKRELDVSVWPKVMLKRGYRRLPRAAHLQGLLSTDLLATTPFLILGNKAGPLVSCLVSNCGVITGCPPCTQIDIPRAANESELKASLGLEGICTGKELTSIPKVRRWHSERAEF